MDNVYVFFYKWMDLIWVVYALVKWIELLSGNDASTVEFESAYSYNIDHTKYGSIFQIHI